MAGQNTTNPITIPRETFNDKNLNLIIPKKIYSLEEVRAVIGEIKNITLKSNERNITRDDYSDYTSQTIDILFSGISDKGLTEEVGITLSHLAYRRPELFNEKQIETIIDAIDIHPSYAWTIANLLLGDSIAGDNSVFDNYSNKLIGIFFDKLVHEGYISPSKHALEFLINDINSEQFDNLVKLCDSDIGYKYDLYLGDLLSNDEYRERASTMLVKLLGKGGEAELSAAYTLEYICQVAPERINQGLFDAIHMRNGISTNDELNNIYSGIIKKLDGKAKLTNTSP